jgi:hypothetical protein
MTAGTNNGGHSAQVKIQLLIDGCSVPVAQLGPDFLLLDQPFEHPPGNARLVLQVDQNERRWDICLPNGVSADENRVSIRTQSCNSA